MKGLPWVFAAFLGLYIATMPPALAPYRDTGEMTSAALTLGVSHPTSYPSYIMLGHLAQKAPLGNRAYRLGLLSAAAAALACAFLYGWAARKWGAGAGLAAAALLGLNGTFWSVAQVQEMYSLWVLAAAGLLALALRLGRGYSPRLWRGFVFLFALALTNRLDLLLWAPGLAWLALGQAEEPRAPLWAGLALLVFPAVVALGGANWPIVLLISATALWRCPERGRLSWALRSSCWGALGLSAYLYLPVRSAQGPWLDWNHPALFSNFLDSLLRTRYGGTLDLLSKNYATGELFGENLALYGRHLWSCFWAPGLALAAAGCWRCAREDRRRWLGMAAAYWWSGPVFLFMANLPPNPHAVAIVDPHYLLSDLVLIFWAAEGAGALGAAVAWAPAVAAALLIAGPLGRGRFRTFDRRGHLFSYDYSRDALRGAPPESTLVAKKDVQLYALWSYQRLQGWRPDVRIVAQGLAGTPWYQAGWRRRDPGLTLGPLSDAAGWRRFCALNQPVYATTDAEIPPELAASISPRGPLYRLLGPEPDAAWLWELAASRGDYDYDAAQDFFTSDLIDSRAMALFRLGSQLSSAGKPQEAQAALFSSWSRHWLFPEPALYLGFLEYSAGRLESAQRYYGFAARILEELLGLAGRYHSLPAVTTSIRRSSAETLVHLGVVAEKRGDRLGAQALYEKSLERHPLAQAHYNLAVLWWNRDWPRVERELEAALRLEPGHADAARFLAQAKARRR